MAGYQCKNVVATSQMFNYSRHDLLRWINVSLNMEVVKVESLCSGGVYCTLLNVLFPGCVPVKKIKCDANQQHEFIANLKVLQNAFRVIGCNKEVPIDKLIQGRYQDNFEFLQWFKRFFDANYGPECDRELRLIQESQQTSRPLLKKNKRLPAGYAARGNVQMSAALGASARPIQQVESQKNVLKMLEKKSEAKKEEIDVMTKERDFYFQKLQQIEVICLEHSQSESGPENPVGPLAAKLLAKLYETEEGLSATEEAEEESY